MVGIINKAEELFDKIHDAYIVSWNTMIPWYPKNRICENILYNFK